MFYVLLADDGSVARYPFTPADLRLAYPNTSFAEKISDDVAAAFNCFPVKPAAQPADDHTVNVSRIAVKQNTEWVEQWVSTPATPAEITERTQVQAAAVRTDRNARLSRCDWTQLSDTPGTTRASYVQYRQALRDIPQQPGFPWNVTWPVDPSI